MSQSKRFSENYGYKNYDSNIQYESINESLKKGLYNLLSSFLVEHEMKKYLWVNFFENLADEYLDPRRMFETSSYEKEIKKWFFDTNTEWYEIYDYVQAISQLELLYLKNGHRGFG